MKKPSVRHKKEERDMLAQNSMALKILNEQINEINLSPEEKAIYESRMKLKSDIATIYESRFKQGHEKGHEKGLAKGKHTKAIETARNCLALGMSIETIVTITGLTKEEIAKL